MGLNAVTFGDCQNGITCTDLPVQFNTCIQIIKRKTVVIVLIIEITRTVIKTVVVSTTYHFTYK